MQSVAASDKAAVDWLLLETYSPQTSGLFFLILINRYKDLLSNKSKLPYGRYSFLSIFVFEQMVRRVILWFRPTPCLEKSIM